MKNFLSSFLNKNKTKISNNENNIENNTNNVALTSQILQELFVIQDSIKNIDEKLSNSADNSAAISILADKLSNNNSQPSMENILLQSFLQTAFNEPQKLQNLLEISEKFKSQK